MEFEEHYRQGLQKVLTRFCLDRVQFEERIKVTTTVVILVDDVTEFEYNFKNLVTRDNKQEHSTRNSLCQTATAKKLKSVETDSDTRRKRQRSRKTKNDRDKKGSVSGDEDLAWKAQSETDNHDVSFNDGSSDREVTEVMPSSPQATREETADEARSDAPEEIACPLCPAKFTERLAVENHLKERHDIGNIYICTVCQVECPSNTALVQHYNQQHGLPDTAPGQEPHGLPDTAPGQEPHGLPETAPSQEPHRLPDTAPSKDPHVSESNQVQPVTSDARKRGSRKVTKTTKLVKAKTKNYAKTRVNVPETGVEEKRRPVTRLALRNKPELASRKRLKFLQSKDLGGDLKERKPSGSYKCSDCGKTYKLKRSLRRHIHNAHAEKSYKCDVCGKCFTGKDSLYHHTRGIHLNVKAYKCEDCGASFNFGHSLKLHRLKHSGQRPHECQMCGKTYLTSNHLKIHVQAIHREKKHFSCKFCSKSFSYLNSLKMHEMIHEDKRPFQCAVCNKGFVNSQALKYHSQSRHSAGGSYTCDICGKNYKTEYLMKTHRRRHTADGTRYMCDICGRQFMYKSTLEVHSAVHKEEKCFTCSVCGKSFKTYATLYSHQYVHKTDSPFKCTDCGKAFKTRERCKAHERRHLGLKPFECFECKRCFPDKGGLSKHLKSVHCLVKKFVCDVCGKSCSRADNLRVHMKIHDKPSTSQTTMPPAPTMVPVSNNIDHSYHSYSLPKKQKSKESLTSTSTQSQPLVTSGPPPKPKQLTSESGYPGNQSDQPSSLQLLVQSADSVPQPDQTSQGTLPVTHLHTLADLQHNMHMSSVQPATDTGSQMVTTVPSVPSVPTSLQQGSVAAVVGAANQSYGSYAWLPYGTYLYGPSMTPQPGANSFYQ